MHLSANICPRHRSAVLWLIGYRLKMGRPCRIISTQLVEAGVEVDFPVPPVSVETPPIPFMA